MRLLHDYFIFDVSLIKFTNFSANAVITFSNKLWIMITEAYSYRYEKTKELSGAFS